MMLEKQQRNPFKNPLHTLHPGACWDGEGLPPSLSALLSSADGRVLSSESTDKTRIAKVYGTDFRVTVHFHTLSHGDLPGTHVPRRRHLHTRARGRVCYRKNLRAETVPRGSERDNHGHTILCSPEALTQRVSTTK